MRNNKNIDYRDFIDSKDIRKYLKDINYNLSPLASSWLIYHSRIHTYDAKHEAWNLLIKESDDFSIKKRMNTVPQKSFHDFLNKYMEIEDRVKAKFFSNDKDWLYTVTIYTKDGEEYNDEGIYDDYKVSIKSLIKDCYLEDKDINYIYCYKRKINEPNNFITAIFNNKKELLSVDTYRENAKEIGLTNKEEDIYYGVFSGLWFDIPTPFKMGDIIYNPKWKKGYLAGPMVLRYLNTEGLSKKLVRTVQRNGDEIDMCASCVFFDEDGKAYLESTDNYIDFEYYPIDKLPENKKTALPFSKYLKGEIDLGLFVESYTYLLLKNMAEALKPDAYTKEALKLVGIE